MGNRLAAEGVVRPRAGIEPHDGDHVSATKGDNMKRKALLTFTALLFAGCGGGDDEDANKPDGPSGLSPATTSPAIRADGTVREPAVAGLWYPKVPQELARTANSLLSATVAGVGGKVRGMIVPHAGWRFCGITAAVAYKQLMGQDVRTAIILAPSHTASFPGASIPNVEAYRTPLGFIKLAPKAAELARLRPFTAPPKLAARRPVWWRQASKLAPPEGQDTPHTWEHSLETQLPFLQWVLGSFQLVPAVYGGSVDPAKAADMLSRFLDDGTVVIASSDLSHYHPYDMAKSLDAWCLKAVREMDIKAMSRQEACGKGPILTLMHLAKERGWKPRVLDYRNSGDIPSGNKDRVVGYMAAVFVEEGAAKIQPLTDADRKFLLGLARRTLTAFFTRQPPPRIDRATLPPGLLKPKGCFVTLKSKEELRGCVGYTLPVQPLYVAVMEMAVNATRDRRFRSKPVTAEELDAITIDISILTVPKPIYYNTPSDLLERLRPNIDGVTLEVPVVVKGRRALANAVYLPSVWKEIPEPEKFMSQLALKAGLAANAWRQPQATIRTFQVEEFQETKE